MNLLSLLLSYARLYSTYVSIKTYCYRLSIYFCVLFFLRSCWILTIFITRLFTDRPLNNSEMAAYRLPHFVIPLTDRSFISLCIVRILCD